MRPEIFGSIFEQLTDCWRSYVWPGDAAVHIGIVNWVMGKWEGVKCLDGLATAEIPTSRSSSIDVTRAKHLAANAGLCFMGVTPGNDGFVLDEEQRAAILADDPKSEAVVKPFLVGRDVNREIDQQPTRWIIDFGKMPQEEAESFRGAMRHVRKHVYPTKHAGTRAAERV